MILELELWGPLRQAHAGVLQVTCNPEATARDVRRAAAEALPAVADLVQVSALATTTRVLHDDERVGEQRLALLPPVSGG